MCFAEQILSSTDLSTVKDTKWNSRHSRLTGEFRKDIAWWLQFTQSYSGVSIVSSLSWRAPDPVFFLDGDL